jgi:hypothetical protein
LSAAVFGSGTPGGEDLSLSEQVTANTTAINVLKGSDEVEGSIAHSIKTAIAALGDVAVKSDIKISEIKVKSGSTITTLTPDTNKSVTVEIPEVQAATTDVAGVVTISDNDAITDTETSTAAATVAAVAATVGVIEGKLGGIGQTINDIEGKLASTGSIGKAISEVKATADSAVQTVKVNGTALTKDADKAVDITAIVGVDGTVNNGIKLNKTFDNKVGISVEHAYYDVEAKGFSTHSITSGYFVTAGDVTTAIADAVGAITIPSVTTSSAAQTVGVTASGHEVSVATATYTASTDTWTNKPYLVTGATVEAYVNDVVSEVSSDLTALENKVNAYHEAGVSYTIHDSQTLPDLSVPANEEKYKNVILLVPTGNGEAGADSTAAIAGGYVEWLCVNKGTKEAPSWDWEQIGTTEADLHGYVNMIDGGNVVDWTGRTCPVYASISSIGYLSIGIDSATSDKLGVSKLFSGDYHEMASVVDKSNTAVSLQTASEMFGGLNSLKANKGDTIHSINGLTGAAHTGLDVTIKTGDNSKLIGLSIETDTSSKSITVSEGLINTPHVHTIDLSSGVTSVDGNVAIINGVKTLIEPEKYVSGFYANTASNLTSWVSDMPNFNNADGHAGTFSGCTSLTTFIGDLSSLENGGSMFNDCTSLTTFIGDLSSLTNGESMFNGCKLDAESIECIAETLPTVTNKPRIHIGYNCSAAYAQSAYDVIIGKGWTCSMTYNA